MTLSPGSDKPRTVLVTGASRGIGAAVAAAFAVQGDRVIGLSRTGAAPEGVLGVRADVTDLSSLEAALQGAARQVGPVEILVTAAGISRDSLAARTSEDRWESVLSTNLTGTFHTVRLVLPAMMRARWGRIVLLSSVIASRGNTGQVAYGAAKAGVEGLTRSLAREVAGRGITVNAVAPGVIDTPMTQALTPAVRQGHVSATPLGRMGRVEEIAAPVVFLASQEASYITGVVLPVDGGLGIGR